MATSESNEPAHRGLPAIRSLWWRWTAPLDGYVVTSTTNSLSHSRVAVYDFHKQLTNLNAEALQAESGLPVAPDRFEFDAVRGRDYNIAVDGRDGESGAVQFDLKTFTIPEILIQPVASNNFTAGQRASIAVPALGKRALTNQWQFSTLTANAGYTNLPSGTNRVLDIGTLGVVSSADQGWYRVIIRNEYGSVTSSVAYVKVNDCATPTGLQPLFVSNNVGKTVSFTASAIGTPPLQFQWQFRPPSQYVFTYLPGATSSNLVLTNISTDNYGDYRFLVSNIACTNASTNATLVVGTTNALVLDPSLRLPDPQETALNLS